jgi:hypothetical protein
MGMVLIDVFLLVRKHPILALVLMGSQHPSGTAELQWVPISVLFFFPDLGD